jgi:putative membrane protein
MRYTMLFAAAILAVSTLGIAQTKKEEVGANDRSFVREAATSGAAEVELGKLALQNAGSESVKRFGQQMIDDHGKAGAELTSIAQSVGVEAPQKPGDKQEAALKKLESLKGASFDQAYARQMVSDHEAAVSLFERQAKSGGSRPLKDFAAKTLPTLREHLKMARALPK